MRSGISVVSTLELNSNAKLDVHFFQFSHSQPEKNLLWTPQFALQEGLRIRPLPENGSL
jgi:hypothetical protein